MNSDVRPSCKQELYSINVENEGDGMTNRAKQLLDDLEALPDRERSEVLTELVRRSSVGLGTDMVPGPRRNWRVGSASSY